MSEQEIADARKFADDIIETAHEAFILLDLRMRVLAANRSFHRMFGTSAEQVRGRSLFELADGRFDIAPLRDEIGIVADSGRPFENLLVEAQSAVTGPGRLRVNGRLLREEDHSENKILLAIEEPSGTDVS